METRNKNNFFILTAPRCGSTVLTMSLDKHPKIFCAGEIFHHSKKIYHSEWHFPFWGTKTKKGFSRTVFTAANFINGYLFAVKHLKKFYSKSRKKKWRGFKLMISHVKDFPAVFNYLQKQQIKVIVLVRKNIFREALSSFRGRQTGVFHTQENVSAETKKIHIHPETFRKRVEELEILHQQIFSLTENMQRIVLYYEEFDEWNKMLNKVFEFLNVEETEIKPTLKKVGTKNWRDGVANYQELENVMQSKYAHLLE